jgi:hypothetical protein
MAYLLKIWKVMTLAQKEIIERKSEKGHLEDEIRAMAREVGVQHKPFPNAEEKKYDTALDKNEDFKKQLGPFAKRIPLQRKKDETDKAKPEHTQTRFDLRVTEFLYFEDHKPRPVSQQNLEKFSAWCPNWFHSMLDPLSADDARNYLTIVYRLIFPDSEITAEWKPAREKSNVIPGGPRPTPKRSGPQPPL